MKMKLKDIEKRLRELNHEIDYLEELLSGEEQPPTDALRNCFAQMAIAREDERETLYNAHNQFMEEAEVDVF